MTALAPAVAEAVEAVRAQFADHPVAATPDGAGGAFVIIDDLPIGSSYTAPTSWLGFHISTAYPDADIYPHCTGVVARADGQPHGPAIQSVTWRDRSALQISRRSNRRDRAVDTAALKAERICRWFADQ
ncbi:hypothetical protein [Streptomyces sp. JNUCC 63]